MNKSQALAVMHEILAALDESVKIGGVSLDPSFTNVSKVPDGFLIKMLCNLDRNSRDSLKPVLQKHKLGMEESKGYVVISAN